MTQKFKKYQSIKRGTDVKELAYYIENGYADKQWYVTEKVHGTNVSFITGGLTCEFAKRSEVTDPTGFFNISEDFHKVQPQIIELAKFLGKQIQVTGEYFGGEIAGKSSIPYFSDKNRKEFIFFDIRIIEDDSYVSFPKNFELFDAFNIPHVPVLQIGTLQECLAFPIDYKSLVAEQDTFAEGYVVKPCEHIDIMPGQRVILKMIASQFDDIKKTGNDLVIAKKKQENFNSFNKTMKVAVYAVNQIRVDKVAAKQGISAEHKRKFKELLDFVVEDIVDEYILLSVDNKESDIDVKQLEKQIIPFIKQFFK